MTKKNKKMKFDAHSVPKAKKGTLKRLFKMLWSFYPISWVIIFVCLALIVIANASASLFLQNITETILKGSNYVKEGHTNLEALKYCQKDLLTILIVMIAVRSSAVIASVIQNQLMAKVTQGSLNKIRIMMFNKMESLPIKYFDQHNNGDIMSFYTNDTDSLRQMISQCIVQLVQSIIMLLILLGLMAYFSIWLALVVFAGIFAMLKVSQKLGGNAGKGFMMQQKKIAQEEGFVEEMMNGQKVVKVFCYEEEAKKKFDKVNNELCQASEFADANASKLGPVTMNIGNIMYVSLAFLGGILIVLSLKGISVFNFSILGKKEISLQYYLPIVISFLTLSRQFTNNVNQVAQQYNTIVMAQAAADRILSLIDEEKEVDDGYVTLVNAIIDDEGNISESEKRTGIWAWKHPHSDGTITYTKLNGDIRMFDVDFGYIPEKIVLHDVTLYAEPGQKVAFVGSTGAGKTTITNLINRFYDIADGKVRYDGININKIKKADLRRSLGIVLQDTNLFTGTVMDNIRYGKLDATDEECIEAAKLSNAHDFITRLPEGYNTKLVSDGANLSQGQRQLLSIARAAVCNAPVMILDEATSSIDTRTELLVQKGTDQLMKGRTVFVIAHRLSTVQNSDVIMVLEHGVIIERGSHEELIKKKGKYYQLYTGAFELE